MRAVPQIRTSLYVRFIDRDFTEGVECFRLGLAERL